MYIFVKEKWNSTRPADMQNCLWEALYIYICIIIYIYIYIYFIFFLFVNTDHGHPRMKVVWRSWLTLHFNNETSCFNSLSRSKSSKFSVEPHRADGEVNLILKLKPQPPPHTDGPLTQFPTPWLLILDFQCIDIFFPVKISIVMNRQMVLQWLPLLTGFALSPCWRLKSCCHR